MKKLVALLLSVMMCFACVSALADTYVSWYTYGDVYLSSVRSGFFRRMNTVPGWNTDGCARTAKGRSVHNLLSILQIMNDWRPGASMMRWNAHRVGKPLM